MDELRLTVNPPPTNRPVWLRGGGTGDGLYPIRAAGLGTLTLTITITRGLGFTGNQPTRVTQGWWHQWHQRRPLPHSRGWSGRTPHPRTLRPDSRAAARGLFLLWSPRLGSAGRRTQGLPISARHIHSTLLLLLLLLSPSQYAFITIIAFLCSIIALFLFWASRLGSAGGRTQGLPICARHLHSTLIIIRIASFSTIHIRTYIHTYIHTHTQTYIHTHIYIYIYIPPPSQFAVYYYILFLLWASRLGSAGGRTQGLPISARHIHSTLLLLLLLLSPSQYAFITIIAFFCSIIALVLFWASRLGPAGGRTEGVSSSARHLHSTLIILYCLVVPTC